jgi:1,4-dihydroxy-2-naphthoyl-CoA hydrolase
MLKHLDIQIEEIRPDSLLGSMPVDHRTIQPFGLLHGGASCTLAESLGSIASNLILDPTRYYSVGQSIVTNHLRSLRQDRVFGIARPIHLGKSSHVWQIDLAGNRDFALFECASRTTLTMSILERRA